MGERVRAKTPGDLEGAMEAWRLIATRDELTVREVDSACQDNNDSQSLDRSTEFELRNMGTASRDFVSLRAWSHVFVNFDTSGVKMPSEKEDSYRLLGIRATNCRSA
jgi:hypothetical protein